MGREGRMKGFGIKSHTCVSLADVCSFSQLLELMWAQEGSSRGQSCFSPLEQQGECTVDKRRPGVLAFGNGSRIAIYVSAWSGKPDNPSLCSHLLILITARLRSIYRIWMLFVRKVSLWGRGSGLILPAEAIIFQQLFIVNCSPYLQPERWSLI